MNADAVIALLQAVKDHQNGTKPVLPDPKIFAVKSAAEALKKAGITIKDLQEVMS